MKKNILSKLIALSALSALPLHAESLLEVYQLAKSNDPALRSALDTYQAEKHGVDETRGSLYPEITFSGSLGYATSDAPDSDIDTLSNSLALNMNYPIYSPALGYAVDAVELSYESAGVDFEQAEEDLALNAMTEYFDLLIAQASLKTVEAQEKSTASQLDRVKKQFEVGLASITDMQEAQAGYDAVQVELVSARSEVQQAQVALRLRTGQPINTIPELSSEYKIELSADDAVDIWLEKARKHNSTIRKLNLTVASAENNVNIQKSNGRTPTVALTGSLSRTDNDYSPDLSSEGVTNAASIGLSVTIPLYKGGAINASVKKAVSTKEAALESRDSALQSMELNIRKLHRDLRTTVAQVKAQEQLIRSRTSALDATQAGYEVGTRNIVELLDAQSRLYDAQNTYQQLRYGFVVKRLNLLKLAGELNQESIEKLNHWLK